MYMRARKKNKISKSRGKGKGRNGNYLVKILVKRPTRNKIQKLKPVLETSKKILVEATTVVVMNPAPDLQIRIPLQTVVAEQVQAAKQLLLVQRSKVHRALHPIPLPVLPLEMKGKEATMRTRKIKTKKSENLLKL